jgi:hypothetical protein
MGRKSSAKAQPRPASATGSPSDGPSGGMSPLKLGGIGAVALAIVAAVYIIGARQAPNTAQNPAAPAVADVPEAANFGPHPQENLPPLPFIAEPPARSPEVVRAAYKFAAEHAEVLSYVPCYCGCERSGHRGNEDCFVTQRDAKGDVTQWEPHGMT